MEKINLQRLNQDLNRIVQEKNAEIDQLNREKFELENRILMETASSLKPSRVENEMRDKLDELIAKYSTLDSKVREKDSEIHKANHIIEVLKNELISTQQLQSNYEYELKVMKNERENLYEVSNSLKGNR